jgi:hypothetical protein
MQYEIDISIDSNGLKTIAAASQSVTIAKTVTYYASTLCNVTSDNAPSASTEESTASATSPTSVAWLAFSPFESNTITWQDSYYIFASTASLKVGSSVTVNSETLSPVQTNITYILSNGTFTIGPSVSDTAFYAANQQGNEMKLGLAQKATVNGTTVNSPLNAIPVLFNECVQFTPQESIYIFLSSANANGIEIPSLSNNQPTVTLDTYNPTAKILC